MLRERKLWFQTCMIVRRSHRREPNHYKKNYSIFELQANSSFHLTDKFERRNLKSHGIDIKLSGNKGICGSNPDTAMSAQKQNKLPTPHYDVPETSTQPPCI